MIKSFRFNDGAIDILYERADKTTVKTCPKHLWRKAFRVLSYLNKPNCIAKFRSIPGSHLEKLKEELAGYWSVRIDGQFRVVFKYDKTTDHVFDVFITDYH